jgi:hypothetical protein
MAGVRALDNSDLLLQWALEGWRPALPPKPKRLREQQLPQRAGQRMPLLAKERPQRERFRQTDSHLLHLVAAILLIRIGFAGDLEPRDLVQSLDHSQQDLDHRGRGGLFRLGPGMDDLGNSPVEHYATVHNVSPGV